MQKIDFLPSTGTTSYRQTSELILPQHKSQNNTTVFKH